MIFFMWIELDDFYFVIINFIWYKKKYLDFFLLVFVEKDKR